MCNNRPDRNPPNRPQIETVRVLTNPSPIARELQIILNLQRQAEDRINAFSCNRNELGNPSTMYNTRPFILYLPNGDEFSIRTDLNNNFTPLNSTSLESNSNPVGSIFNNNSSRSSNRAFIFRVEDLNGNRATLRALKYVLGKYIPTCHCCIVDLDEFAAIQPLNDTYVNLVC